MEGGQLYYRIINRKEKPYTERDAARYISMIVEAITHLHKMDIVRIQKGLLFDSNEFFLFLFFRLIVSNSSLTIVQFSVDNSRGFKTGKSTFI